MKTTNYINTLIEIADDCPVNKSEIPPLKGDKKTLAYLQFELINNNPYKYTSDDIIFKIHAIKNNIPEEDLRSEKEKFFSKGQPCFRSSPLTKRYGWAIHSNDEGKVALIKPESEEYQNHTSNQAIKKLKAMRSKKA